MILSYIQKTKVAKEPLVGDKYQNNENEMNTENEDGNYMDIALVKVKYKTKPSEDTEDKKGKNQVQKNQNHNCTSQLH